MEQTIGGHVPEYGEVFTRPWVVETLLDLVGYTSDRDLGTMTLVEPSVGSGAFLGPIVDRLVASVGTHEGSFGDVAGALRCFDLQAQNVVASRAVAAERLRSAGCDEDLATTLAAGWVKEADYLLIELDLGFECDFVVGNPPYIRIEDLDTEVSNAYRKRWTTMTGRADIYVGFIERSLSMLSEGGQVGFICADRWMRNQYGASLRAMVATDYAVDAVWVMHDVDAFETQVSAYPAITVLRRGEQGPAVVASTDSAFGPAGASGLVDWSLTASTSEHIGRGVQAHRLPHWFPAGEMWPAGTPARLALVELLNDRCPPLHDPTTGTKVGIGIATGADKTYIVKDRSVAEEARTLPLSMVGDLASGTYKWSGHYLLNPWEPNGTLVDLDSYPLLRKHLESAESQLRGRHTAKKAPDSWHRTIDKVNHAIVDLPKLLIQDMRASINPVLEPGGHYPHHNVYFVVSETWDMEVLGGLLLSRIAQAFIEAYGVRIRGGTLRFQSQYLKRIRVPSQDSIGAPLAERLRVAFRTRDADAATEAAAVAYGIELSDFDLDSRDRAA